MKTLIACIFIGVLAVAETNTFEKNLHYTRYNEGAFGHTIGSGSFKLPKFKKCPKCVLEKPSGTYTGSPYLGDRPSTVEVTRGSKVNYRARDIWGTDGKLMHKKAYSEILINYKCSNGHEFSDVYEGEPGEWKK